MSTNLVNEDVRKLHNEINQIVNQRFLLGTAAVTVFGVVAAWIIPKSPPAPGESIGTLAYAVTVLLIILLFALFLLSQLLKNVLRTYSAYLLVGNLSKWEKDWKTYREGGHFTYTKAMTIVFLLLGILTTFFPVGIGVIYSLKFESEIGFWIILVLGFLYAIFVIGMGLLGWFDHEEAIEQRWRGVLCPNEVKT
jgi:hypothetical protein